MATIKRSKNGKAWVLSWYEKNGIRTRAQIPRSQNMSEREANLIKKAKELELETGEVVAMPRSRNAVTFNQLSHRYLEWRATKFPASQWNIKRINEDVLCPLFGEMALVDIDSTQVETFLARRASQSKPATIIKELNTIKAMVKKAIEWKLITHDAIRAVPEPQILDDKPPPYFSKAQLDLLYAVNSAYTPIWRLMANTGMRRAEVLNLRWRDIVDGKIRILSSGTHRTKSAKWRPVGIGPGAQAALDLLAEDPAIKLAMVTAKFDPTQDDWVIPHMLGRSLSRCFKADLKAAGIRAGSVHWLRHTFITLMIQKGVNLRTVQLLAGHSTIAVTEKYAHVSAAHFSNSVADLDL